MDSFKTLRDCLYNSLGFKTNKKILVIESDDWGSVRTSSLMAYQKLSQNIPHLNKDNYCKFDALEDCKDLLALFEVLNSVKDQYNNPAIVTANTIVANPNFDAIRAENFENYIFESIENTFLKRDNDTSVLKLYYEGIEKRVFFPQLHGREHLNVSKWMNGLKSNNKELRLAFDYKMYGIPLSQPSKFKRSVMAAWDFTNFSELYDHEKIINEAQTIFTNLFGFKSSTIIAPSYIWHPIHDSYFLRNDIIATQGLPYQYIPNPNGRAYKKKLRYTSGKPKLLSLVRNVFFEPSLKTSRIGIVDDCLRRIDMAFKMGKPAIICAHRINFIGSLVKSNRENNLIMLRELLHKVVKKWNDVEFLTSSDLTQIIKSYYNDKKASQF